MIVMIVSVFHVNGYIARMRNPLRKGDEQCDGVELYVSVHVGTDLIEIRRQVLGTLVDTREYFRLNNTTQQRKKRNT